MRAVQRVGGHVRRHPTGHLGHGGEEREATVVIGDGLVGDARSSGEHQVLRLRRIGREVKVREEEVVLPKELPLLGLRLLHLHDHRRLGEQLVRGVDDLGAGGHVGVVVGADPDAGAALDQHVVTVTHELVHAVGREPDAAFGDLDLGGGPDSHAAFLLPRRGLVPLGVGHLRAAVWR